MDRVLCGAGVQILMYHGFTDGECGNDANNKYGTHLNIAKFAEQIAYLKKHYHIISLPEWVQFCKGKGRIPGQSVILTFDDGYESNYLMAFPVLKKYNVPATIFVTTDFIEGHMFFLSNRLEFSIRNTPLPLLSTEIMGVSIRLNLKTSHDKDHAIGFIWQAIKGFRHEDRIRAVSALEDILQVHLTAQSAPAFWRPLNWAQCREMIQSGLVTIGCHTCSHPSLAHCDPLFIEEEVQISRAKIEKNTGSSCDLFCYPYGGKDDFNAQTKEILMKLQYQAALTTLSGSNQKNSQLMELRRLGTSNEHTLEDFKRLLLQSYRILRKEYKQAYQVYAHTRQALGILPK